MKNLRVLNQQHPLNTILTFMSNWNFIGMAKGFIISGHGIIMIQLIPFSDFSKNMFSVVYPKRLQTPLLDIKSNAPAHEF